MINEVFDIPVCTYLMLSFQEDLIRVTEIPLFLHQMLQCIKAFRCHKTYILLCQVLPSFPTAIPALYWWQMSTAKESWRDSLSQEADSICMFTHMMSCLCSNARIFALSEVFYFLRYGLWPNWQQSLCNLVFVFYAKEHKLSSLIFVVSFVINKPKLF